MSNICNGQLQQANQIFSKTVSLTPLVQGNKMNQLIVVFLIVATLLESPASSGASESLTSSRLLNSNRLVKKSLANHSGGGHFQYNPNQVRATRRSSDIAPIESSKMQHSGPRKRSPQVSRSSFHGPTSNQSKKFRRLVEEETLVSRESAFSSGNTTTSSRNHSDNDVNNNNNQNLDTINDGDNNNNTVYSVARTRQVSSLNGTIDLSRYEQDDVDRLYSDALLVYVKNFNETLPVRREMLSLGSNKTNRVPIYRSDTRLGSSNGWPTS